MSDKLTDLPDGVASGALFYTVSAGESSKVTGGAANGVATLDGGGKVPSNLLPALGVSYQGLWNASTNTPPLANGVGTAGDFYFVSVAGSQNLGSGVIAFDVNDRVIYEGGVWELAPAHSGVQTVNTKPGPDVVLNAADVGALAAPVGAGASTVVGYNLGGQYSAVPYSQDTTGFNLIMRDIDGRAQFPDPAAATDVANRQWVEAQIVSDPAPAWGVITGTLADQVDLHNALDAKADDTALATHVANVAVGAHVPTGGNSGQVLTRGAGATSAWAAVTGSVQSVNGKTGVVLLGPDDVDAVSQAVAPNQVYTTDGSAQQSSLPYNPTGLNTPGGVAVFTSNGTLNVIPPADNDPLGAINLTSIGALRDVANGLAGLDGSAKVHVANLPADAAATPSTLALRDSAGRLKVVDPAVAADVATKNYVDTHPGVTGGVPATSQGSRVYVTTPSGDQSQIPYSNTEAEGNAMARYTQDGELYVSTPTDPSRAANKAYVDSAIAAGGVQSPQIIQGPAATTVLHDAAPLTVVVNASLGSQSVTLDFGISAGKRITFVREDNGHPTFSVTIDPDGGMINGQQATITLDAQWTVKNLIKVNSSDWVAY